MNTSLTTLFVSIYLTACYMYILYYILYCTYTICLHYIYTIYTPYKTYTIHTLFVYTYTIYVIAIPIQIGTGVFIATAGANKIMLHQVHYTIYFLY